MSRWSLMLGVCLVAGCQGEPPPPPVVPMVEDLSTWSVPELVQPERRGAYAARNAGLRVASAGFVAFTDVDCRPHEDWIERGLAWLSAAPRVAGRVQLELSRSPSTPELVDAGRFFRQRRYVEEDVQRRVPITQKIEEQVKREHQCDRMTD